MTATDQSREELRAWQDAKKVNFFRSDPNFQQLLQAHMGEAYPQFVELLENTGELAGTRMNELAIETNRDENLPVLRSRDAIGRTIEQVVFHDSYHELGRLIWGTGVLRLLRQPGNETRMGALIYLMAHNGEAGHLCPVACTAGTIKLIRKVGTEEQEEKYLPRLLEKDYDTRLHASQFLTEVQGGSDVGSNACVAVPQSGGRFRISGEKWFCSVMDAGLFVVTARPEGAGAGTKGLGLFLVPRVCEDGRINNFSIKRLKYKLGTRSMATGEAQFNGSLAEPIGRLDQGFRNVVGIVLDTSRLHNAICACGIMRRAFLEAWMFAKYRKAFGRPIGAYGLVRRTLARMKTDTCAALATTFRILQMSDELETMAQPDQQRADARRVLVMMNKYRTAALATEVVRAGIEVLGGNGTIEDFSVLPRLYRDAMVIESWEGTHNTLCLQILRDFSVRSMHESWLLEMKRLLEMAGRQADAEDCRRAGRYLHDIIRRMEKILVAPEESATVWTRDLVNRMWVLFAYLSLMLQPAHAVTDYFRMCYIDPVDSLDDPSVLDQEKLLSATL